MPPKASVGKAKSGAKAPPPAAKSGKAPPPAAKGKPAPAARGSIAAKGKALAGAKAKATPIQRAATAPPQEFGGTFLGSDSEDAESTAASDQEGSTASPRQLPVEGRRNLDLPVEPSSAAADILKQTEQECEAFKLQLTQVDKKIRIEVEEAQTQMHQQYQEEFAQVQKMVLNMEEDQQRRVSQQDSDDSASLKQLEEKLASRQEQWQEELLSLQNEVSELRVRLAEKEEAQVEMANQEVKTVRSLLAAKEEAQVEMASQEVKKVPEHKDSPSRWHSMSEDPMAMRDHVIQKQLKAPHQDLAKLPGSDQQYWQDMMKSQLESASQEYCGLLNRIPTQRAKLECAAETAAQIGRQREESFRQEVEQVKHDLQVSPSSSWLRTSSEPPENAGERRSKSPRTSMSAVSWAALLAMSPRTNKSHLSPSRPLESQAKLNSARQYLHSRANEGGTSPVRQRFGSPQALTGSAVDSCNSSASPRAGHWRLGAGRCGPHVQNSRGEEGYRSRRMPSGPNGQALPDLRDKLSHSINVMQRAVSEAQLNLHGSHSSQSSQRATVNTAWVRSSQDGVQLMQPVDRMHKVVNLVAPQPKRTERPARNEAYSAEQSNSDEDEFLDALLAPQRSPANWSVPGTSLAQCSKMLQPQAAAVISAAAQDQAWDDSIGHCGMIPAGHSTRPPSHQDAPPDKPPLFAMASSQSPPSRALPSNLDRDKDRTFQSWKEPFMQSGNAAHSNDMFPEAFGGGFHSASPAKSPEFKPATQQFLERCKSLFENHDVQRR